jgi:hypothetical protein
MDRYGHEHHLVPWPFNYVYFQALITALQSRSPWAMLTTSEHGNEGKMKAPIVFGTAGTTFTFWASHYSEMIAALAGTLTCVYLVIQIYFRLKHERERRRKEKSPDHYE